ncbi:hypothetical protein V8E54_013649 [Elaphomyces granulatus]
MPSNQQLPLLAGSERLRSRNHQAEGLRGLQMRRHRAAAAASNKDVSGNCRLIEARRWESDSFRAWVLEREAGGSYSVGRRVATIRKALQKPGITDVIGFPLVESAPSDAVFHRELKALIDRPLFNRFDAVEMIGKLEDIDFGQARREICLYAPG